MICRYCLKPNIKTTCSSEMLAQSCISMHMHLMIAFVKLLLLSSYYCIHRGRKRCNSKIGSIVGLLRLTFSQLFSSDFRRPRALRYRQARGCWGEKYFALPKVSLELFLQQKCVVSQRAYCVIHSNQTAGSARRVIDHCTLSTQPCQLVGLVWFGLVGRRTKTKPDQPRLGKAGGKVV